MESLAYVVMTMMVASLALTAFALKRAVAGTQKGPGRISCAMLVLGIACYTLPYTGEASFDIGRWFLLAGGLTAAAMITIDIARYLRRQK